MSSFSFLESIVNKKRKAVDDLAQGNKFIRLGDLPHKEREKFEKKQQGLRDKDHENKTDELKYSANDVLKEVKDIPRPEVIIKLRERNLPIRLFGENDRDAFLRLRQHEVDAPDLMLGRMNEHQQALNRAEEEVLDEIVHGTYGKKEKKNEFFIEPTEEFWESVKERGIKIGLNDNIKEDCTVIYDFLVFILSKWQAELDKRGLEEKTSPKGRLRTAHFQQTMKDVEPLLRALSKGNVNSDQRCHLVNIVRIILIDHNYIIANNAYMELAIGNAPWPVGVTRSGIHQRPGSAKAYVNQIAHILNNETQRKYIHGLKRVMSKCQDYYPADPSKCFEFVKKDEL
uniref:Pre-mRNA-splicing factor 18 n=1 Tax=Panagrolaimus sp. PS1159 TaxID=55785 RepID=A0AC35GUN2_9BILA